MFDVILREAAERFGLGDNAKQFLGQLLAMMFNPSSGGFSGFLQKFKDAGLGDQVASWVGGNPGDNELQPDQVHAALGSDTISSLAGKLGLPAAAVSMATAGLLPKLIGGLTPGGRIPTEMPAGLSGLLSGFGGVGDAMGRGAGAATSAIGGAAASAAASAQSAAGGGMGWLKWLLPLLLLIGGFLLFRSCQKQEAVAPAADTAPVATEPAPAPDANAGMESTPPDAAAPAETAPPPAEATPEPAAPEAAAPDASAALSALEAGKFTADDLVKALNLTGIQFDTGSSKISAASQDILGKAAEALKKAPAGTRVEIGGHTDNTGNANANLKLSDARANAVRSRLMELGVDEAMLAAKGYGDAKPVADNATTEGRAKNRRMEFSVMK